MYTLTITPQSVDPAHLLAKLRTTPGFTTHQWQWLHFLITHPERHIRNYLGLKDRRCCLGQMCEMFFAPDYVFDNRYGLKTVMMHKETGMSSTPALPHAQQFGFRYKTALFIKPIQLIIEQTSYVTENLITINDLHQTIYPAWHLVALVCLTFPSNIFTTYTHQP